ncbi:entry exclusion lipoprotein TrbK [Pseudomonas putida]|uniref:entry exclusion lipoprotein TrbK n=1 Tax=Pseudomonas putida TaxID=303 RepID=UPI0018AC13C7|nr:entry exclusion lipoprotein TrbK [Pseudomonas putida]MBF8669733.1 entry exclusion lipoprotein TrbK [Pseudomonas putida]MBF8712687.1 entry exclusion lipoprotein TrbK [Pseudomonas putida]
MTTKSVIFLTAALASGFAMAVGEADYSVSEEHCTPEYWEKLPDGKKTEDLIDKCDDLKPSENGGSGQKVR